MSNLPHKSENRMSKIYTQFYTQSRTIFYDKRVKNCNICQNYSNYRMKGSFRIRSFVDVWYRLISLSATVPGLYLLFFFGGFAIVLLPSPSPVSIFPGDPFLHPPTNIYIYLQLHNSAFIIILYFALSSIPLTFCKSIV